MRASIALMNDHPLALGQEDQVRGGAVSERLGPLHGHELVTVAGFGDVAGRWERRVVERDLGALRRRHAEHPAPGVAGLVPVHVEHRLPIGVARPWCTDQGCGRSYPNPVLVQMMRT